MGNSNNSLQTFDGVLQEIQGVISSDNTPFGKCFAIKELVKPEILGNINIPDLFVSDSLQELVPNDVNNISV